jgi:hypothetical protein
MNPRDLVTGDDDQFTLLLACYSEVLAAGGRDASSPHRCLKDEEPRWMIA